MIEEDIRAVIGDAFSGRVYPDTAPANTDRPFVIYQNVGGQPVSALCGNGEKLNARIQFWVWSDTREEANRKMREIAALVTEAPLHAVSQGELVARYDEVTRLRGALQDFSFWFTSTAP